MLDEILRPKSRASVSSLAVVLIVNNEAEKGWYLMSMWPFFVLLAHTETHGIEIAIRCRTAN